MSKHTMDCDIWKLNESKRQHCHLNSISYLKYENRIEEYTDPGICEKRTGHRPRLDNSMKNTQTYEMDYW